jgi:hypothetical protein
MNSPNASYIPNYLVWSILSTLFCCLPLGIVSIVYASQVDGRRLAGDLQGAQELSHKAKMWAIYAAISGPVLILLWIMAFGGLAALGSMSGVH